MTAGRLWVVLVAGLVASMLAAASAVAQDATESGFSDVTGGVHEPAIDALAAMGVFEGTQCAEGMFCPGDDMKRWTMGVWLVRVLDEAEPPAVAESSFADVDFERWWLPHVERLAELEVTEGCLVDPLRFCPDRSVDRAQMATFLVRAFDLEAAEPAGFTDTVGNFHEADIDALAAARITAGCSTTPRRYCSDKPVTRSEMATFLARALGLVEVPAPAAALDSADPIRIPLHNWSSQIVGAEVVGGILESAGFAVEYVPSDGQVVYQSMCDGDIELAHEVWEGAFGVAFQQQVDKGCVLDWATHNAVTREEWWYPVYVEEQCPGLPDWEALNACAHLFATAETGNKGRFLYGPVHWLNDAAERVEALEMDFEVINAGSAATLWAELDAASAGNTPIVLFNWTPNFVEAVHEGRFIEFPTFEDACLTDPEWGINSESTHDCGSPVGYLKTAVGEHFPEKWPTAAAIVGRMDFTNPMLAAMAAAVQVHGKRPSEAATEWLAANEDLWQSWITG